MSLLEKLSTPLRAHAVLVGMGVSPERALRLVTNHNLSFTHKYMSLTETYRAQLKTIAQSVDVNITAMLGMLTTDQLAEVINNHKHIEWIDPNLNTMELRGISKDNVGFILEFEETMFGGKPSYRLHDLEIQDVLAFMASCENVLYSSTIQA